MANRKTITHHSGKRNKPAAEPDYQLVLDCCTVAAGFYGFAAAFNVDIDDDNKHAAAIGGRLYDDARRVLAQVTKTPARTIAGLLAKARLLPIVMADDRGCTLDPSKAVFGSMEESSAAFYLSFAADVKKFLESMTPFGDLNTTAAELLRTLQSRHSVFKSPDELARLGVARS